jgi:hypothetical protein
MSPHGHDEPLSAHAKETVDLWVSDFLERPAAKEPAASVGADAPDVLTAFLTAACHGGIEPADVGPEEAAHALLDHVSALALPPMKRDAVPDLVAAFLGDLEDVGRLSDGRGIAARVRAAAPAFRERAAGKAPDLTRRAAKIGRNDPCPCGSGKKYKRCCLGA